MMRSLLMAVYGLVAGAAFAAIVHVAIPGTDTTVSFVPFRGFWVVLFMGWYGWFFGRDKSIPDRRLLAEIPLIPFALIGALLAVIILLAGFIFVSLCSLWRK